MLSRPFHSRCHAEMCPSAAQEGRLAGTQQAHEKKQVTGPFLRNSCPGKAGKVRRTAARPRSSTSPASEQAPGAISCNLQPLCAVFEGSDAMPITRPAVAPALLLLLGEQHLKPQQGHGRAHHAGQPTPPFHAQASCWQLPHRPPGPRARLRMRWTCLAQGE